jgi:Double zinc ribbon
MDDLDRMFRRLVQNIRNGYPEYLAHPFEVSELYQHLIPYRHNRRELAIETNQDYEVALCRLLSGERGYLVVDDAMRDTIRRELSAPNPNTAIFREFAAARVSLAPDAQRRYEELGDEAEGQMRPADTATVASAAAPRISVASTTLSPEPTPRSASSPAAPSGAPFAGAAPASEGGAAPARAPSLSGRPLGGEAAECRYCGGALPTDRRPHFCPHCGQNLMVQRCPACGTELELGWKFCITCGRSVASS